MQPPAVVPERFELRATLGEGGFGVVYDAFDRERGEPVALKVLHRTTSDAARRFKREFRTLVDVRHRHLVELHDLGGEGHRLWLSMERIEGALPFDRWVLAGGEIDDLRLQRSLTGLLEGLAALHERHLVHRDLKPSNVLVDAAGRVVVVDFGLCLDALADTSTQLVGTPRYAAPELLDGPPSPAADIYALGVMLYELLAGRPPHLNEGPHRFARRLEDPPSLAEVAPHTPKRWATLVMRCLRRDPAARPHAHELLAEVRGAPEPLPKASSEIVGRAVELSALRAAVERRDARLVIVEGPSGIGKSTLLDRFVETMEGAWVLRGRCHPRESVPFKALDEIIEDLAVRLARTPDHQALLPRHPAALRRLFPALAPILTAPGRDEASDRQRGIEALRELLARLADRHPVVLAIDDLQWGDADSATLLVELLRRPGAPRICVIASRRSDESGEMLERLHELMASGLEIEVETLEVPAMTESESRELILKLGGEIPTRSTLHEAAGRPLWLRAIAHHGGCADFDALFQEALTAQPATRQELFRILSVAGQPIVASVLGRVLGRPVQAELEALVQGRLVRRTPRGYRPDHDRLADIVEQKVSTAERRRLQAALAESLHAHDGDPEAVGALFEAAGDARCAELLLDAARRARRSLAYQKASSLFRRARESRRRFRVELTRAQTHELELELAEALAVAGRASDASEAFLRAADTAANRETAIVLRSRAALQLLVANRIVPARALYERTLTQVGVRFPQRTAAALIGFARASIGRRLRPRNEGASAIKLATLRSAIGPLLFLQPVTGIALAAEYAAEAEGSDDPLVKLRAAGDRAIAATSRRGRHGLDAAWPPLQSAVALTAGHEDPAVEEARFFVEAMTLFYGLDMKASKRRLETMLELQTCRAGSWSFEAAAARVLLSSVFYITGDLPRARRFTPTMALEASERDSLLFWLFLRLHAGWLEACQQPLEMEVIRRHIEELRRRWLSGDNEMQELWLRLGLVVDDLGKNRAHTAYERMHRTTLDTMTSRAFGTRYHYLEELATKARTGLLLATQRPRHRHRLLRSVAEQHAILAAEPGDLPQVFAAAIDAGRKSLLASEDATTGALIHLLRTARDAEYPGYMAIAALELAARTGDRALRDEGQSFVEESGLHRVTYFARTLLPGAFQICALGE